MSKWNQLGLTIIVTSPELSMAFSSAILELAMPYSFSLIGDVGQFVNTGCSTSADKSHIKFQLLSRNKNLFWSYFFFKAFSLHKKGGGGSGGFFLAYEDFGRMFGNSFPACTFFFKVEICLCTLIPLFRPESVHSGSASWDDCNQAFPDELHVSSFPDRFPNYACTAA